MHQRFLDRIIQIYQSNFEKLGPVEAQRLLRSRLSKKNLTIVINEMIKRGWVVAEEKKPSVDNT